MLRTYLARYMWHETLPANCRHSIEADFIFWGLPMTTKRINARLVKEQSHHLHAFPVYLNSLSCALKILKLVPQTGSSPVENAHSNAWHLLVIYIVIKTFHSESLRSQMDGLSPFEVRCGYKPRMHFDWDRRSSEYGSKQERISRSQAQKGAKIIQGYI